MPNTGFVTNKAGLLSLVGLRVRAPARLVSIGNLKLSGVRIASTNKLHVNTLMQGASLTTRRHIHHSCTMLSHTLLTNTSNRLHGRTAATNGLLRHAHYPCFCSAGRPYGGHLPKDNYTTLRNFDHRRTIMNMDRTYVTARPDSVTITVQLLSTIIRAVAPRKGAHDVALTSFCRPPKGAPRVRATLLPNRLVITIALPPPLNKGRVCHGIHSHTSCTFTLMSITTVVRPSNDKHITLNKMTRGP